MLKAPVDPGQGGGKSAIANAQTLRCHPFAHQFYKKKHMFFRILGSVAPRLMLCTGSNPALNQGLVMCWLSILIHRQLFEN